MSSITIYHNPNCGTSRNTLAMIRQSGAEPNIIEYLQTPPNRAELKALLKGMGLGVRAVLRQKGTPYEALDLGNAKWTDEQLLDFVAEHPILMNRPIVVTPLGVRLCRPSEAVLDILPNAQIGPFTKEDGEVVEERKTSSLVVSERLGSSRGDRDVHAVSVGNFERLIFRAQFAQFRVCEHSCLSLKTLPSQHVSVKKSSASGNHGFTVKFAVKICGSRCTA